ncbi:uncharacterized protein K02A2.6-like [Eutrema salsugineum]|uniref:uncharacterized protein K02A2.6-like n=1 Tax=Eutrema salsugineum TaxID=72664 RepID=UPI000CED7B32|nr:uncharacterized protein K02A2.6-like [Eutrema salsugineum]
MDELADEILEELNAEDPLQVVLTREQSEHGYLNEESEVYKRLLDQPKELEAETKFLELRKSGLGILDIGESKTVGRHLRISWPQHFMPRSVINHARKLFRGLRYAFLGSNSSYPVIINDNLLEHEEGALLSEHRKFRRAIGRMAFGLCNAPATFQRCKMHIFSDLFEEKVEVLKRCEEHRLALNWEKCHFMVQEGIVLGHKVSERGIKVDKAKIEVMVNLQAPNSVKGIRSFLGNAGFYRRFIKDFFKTARPLTRLL